MLKSVTLREVGLVVRDLEMSLEWYKEHFGFELLFEVSNGVVIGNEGVELWLAEAPDPDTAGGIDTTHDICIRMIGFHISEEDLARVDAEFGDQDDIIEVEHPRYTSRIIEDPDGHSIELYVYK